MAKRTPFDMITAAQQGGLTGQAAELLRIVNSGGEDLPEETLPAAPSEAVLAVPTPAPEPVKPVKTVRTVKAAQTERALPLRRRPGAPDISQLNVRIPTASLDYADEYLYEQMLAGRKMNMAELIESMLTLLRDEQLGQQVFEKHKELKMARLLSQLDRDKPVS